MKRSQIKRKTPLRRKAALRKRPKPERVELAALHRAVVMLRAGARLEPHASGKGSGWFGKCEHCIRENWLQCAHIEPVGRHPALRYDPDNAVALCVRCHLYWWHKHPREAEAWITAHLGAAKRAALALRAQTTGRPDLELTRIYLETRLAQLERK